MNIDKPLINGESTQRKMDNVVYLDEIRIKRDLAKAESAMRAARALIAEGIDVPRDVLGRLQQAINRLEEKLTPKD